MLNVFIDHKLSDPASSGRYSDFRTVDPVSTGYVDATVDEYHSSNWFAKLCVGLQRIWNTRITISEGEHGNGEANRSPLGVSNSMSLEIRFQEQPLASCDGTTIAVAS